MGKVEEPDNHAHKLHSYNLNNVAAALDEYLESAKLVAISAAKNVEDARLLKVALEALIEKRQKSL